MDQRTETDFLGSQDVPADALHGIHTARALENFPLAGRPVHPELARAYGAVKLACARVNRALGAWDSDGARGGDNASAEMTPAAKADAIERACEELAGGALVPAIVVDALQGGAGTSTNMNVNEVLANRALALLGLPPGRYDVVSPSDDLNRHQSTNDTFPTALRIAAIRLVLALENEVLALQESFQRKEKEFAHVVKIGRTELQDAVLTTLGRTMGAYAEALNRNRWRLSKCEERLRVVNLGGTAIGTGLAAPRAFVFRATDALREITGLPLARAENLVEATQNADAFVEVSGLVRTLATTLVKICGDLRLMASGPDGGLGEIVLPARQAGSSIMPGKVNPVIPEAVTQAALWVIATDSAVAHAAAAGSLELNPFLPLVAHALLDGLDLSARACRILRLHCVDGIAADEARCRRHVENATASATALLPLIGYERAGQLVARAQSSGRGLREVAIADGFVTAAQFDAATSPEAVCRLGSPDAPASRQNPDGGKPDGGKVGGRNVDGGKPDGGKVGG